MLVAYRRLGVLA
jgi:tRNA pseudouridine38-40 synthase